jgi:hypothetical protein
MLKLRLAILGAAAALALGTAGALAMSESAGGGDAHGDAVASAARNCPHGASGVHGACVSAIASANGQAHRDGQQAAKVKACKAAETTNDRAAHIAFAACVSGHAKNTGAPKSSGSTESAETGS